MLCQIMNKAISSPLTPFTNKTGVSQPRKILIFYSSIGHGHICAAQAIKEEICRLAPDASVVLQDLMITKKIASRCPILKGLFSPSALEEARWPGLDKR